MEDAVPPEPDPSSSDRVTTLRLRLPDGTTVQRRFLASHLLQTIVSYVGSLGYHPDEYKLITSYPRRDVSVSVNSHGFSVVKLPLSFSGIPAGW